jgi:hypothetical protein
VVRHCRPYPPDARSFDDADAAVEAKFRKAVRELSIDRFSTRA